MSILLDLIFPRSCLICRRPGSYICPYCQAKLKPGRINFNLSKSIQAHLLIFSSRDQIKRLIYPLKYKFVTDITPQLAKISIRRLKKNFPDIVNFWQEFNFTIIPVPLHQKKLNWRSFNQSSLIAKDISKSLNLEYVDNLLVKSKLTLPQTQTNTKIARLKSQKHSFGVNSNFRKSNLPENIIIFDDIYTTGATTHAAAKALKDCQQIWIVTLI